MSDPVSSPLETILQQCASRTPQPWYPQEDARGVGIPREQLDPLLDELRLGGLVRLTDWVQGKGQGYMLTPAGALAISDPRRLMELRKGALPLPLTEESEYLPDGASTVYRRGEDLRKALLVPKRAVVTLTLLFLNLAVFLVGCILTTARLGSAEPFIMGGAGNPKADRVVSEVLHATGSIRPSDIFPNQQWWRLLSCCFVHIGLVHLLANMVSLWMVGPLLERLWGRWNYLTIYLVSGLVGSCAMIVFERTGGAGASGALWGIIASLGTWVLLNRKALPPALLSSWVRQLVFVFVLNVFITFQVPNISKAAHFGGGLAGLLVAFPLDYARYHTGLRRYLAWATAPLLFVVALALLHQSFSTQRYLTLVNHAEQEAARLYREQPGDFVPKLRERKPISTLSQARIDGVLRELQIAIGQIEHSEPFSDPHLAEAMDAGKKCLIAWEGFYEGLNRFVQAPEKWAVADQAALENQSRRVAEARHGWRSLVEAPR
jgi:rhomboid protease GluP